MGCVVVPGVGGESVVGGLLGVLVGVVWAGLAWGVLWGCRRGVFGGVSGIQCESNVWRNAGIGPRAGERGPLILVLRLLHKNRSIRKGVSL